YGAADAPRWPDACGNGPQPSFAGHIGGGAWRPPLVRRLGNPGDAAARGRRDDGGRPDEAAPGAVRGSAYPADLAQPGEGPGRGAGPGIRSRARGPDRRLRG